MQFYHPEILYGLFALAIPIIVHLFQLRKFKPEPFTNVALLKKLVISSRKSSKLKKWLSLITRMLIITCLVLAFAQPFIPNSNTSDRVKEVSIFLDNSFSMSLKGEKASLFTQAKEELLEALPENQTYNLITHNEVYKNLNTEDFKSLLFDVELYSAALSFDKMLQKTEIAFSNSDNSQKEIIVLSDFQKYKNTDDSISFDSNVKCNLIDYKPQSLLNFSIDTAYVENTANEKLLNFEISASEPVTQSLPVSIYDNDKLLGRFSINFEKESLKSYSFNLNDEELQFGRLEIEDVGLTYDNTLYFSISKPDLIKVLAVSEKSTGYLDRIYQNQRFDFKQVIADQLEFEEISKADVVILNELDDLTNALNIAITNYTSQGGVLIIIPSKKANTDSYNRLFGKLELEPYASLNENTIKLTGINLDHPIFEGVFTEDVQNFDYPSFDSYYANFSAEKALSFSNSLAFLESNKQIFRFNAAISDNSNFAQSPLVVLSFYNIALSAKNKEILYLYMGDNYEVKLNENLQQDEVLSLSKGDFSFIPRQKTDGRNINISFLNYPENSGHYHLVNARKDSIDVLAFNSKRIENHLKYYDLNNFKSTNIFESFSDYTQEFYKSTEIKSLWKWFIILALIFMIIELLLLRFIK
jgi:hypothetical protein